MTTIKEARQRSTDQMLNAAMIEACNVHGDAAYGLGVQSAMHHALRVMVMFVGHRYAPAFFEPLLPVVVLVMVVSLLLSYVF
jgi:hypothetical protein